MKHTTGAMTLYTGAAEIDRQDARDRNARLLEATIVSALFGAVVVLVALLFAPLL